MQDPLIALPQKQLQTLSGSHGLNVVFHVLQYECTDKKRAEYEYVALRVVFKNPSGCTVGPCEGNITAFFIQHREHRWE